MNGFPWPLHAHLPGRNARQPEALFNAVKAAALPETASETALANPAWRFGLELLTAGYFWEAHEVLEAVWRNARPNSRERAMVQGVIQLANGGLKRSMGRARAARRLGGLALGHFEAAGAGGVASVMAVELEAAIVLARSLRDGGEAPLALALPDLSQVG